MQTIEFPLSSTISGHIDQVREEEQARERERQAEDIRQATQCLTHFITTLTGEEPSLTVPEVRIEDFRFKPIPNFPYTVQIQRTCASCQEHTALGTILHTAGREQIINRLASLGADKPWLCCECRTHPIARAVNQALAWRG